MNKPARPLLIAFALAATFGAHEASARQRQEAPARYVRASVHDRYPIGARDFYYQFADTRTLAPDLPAASDPLTGLLGNGAIGTLAVPVSMTETSARLADEPIRGSAVARADQIASEPANAPTPLSRMALPVAALGLMLFVARRRSIF